MSGSEPNNSAFLFVSAKVIFEKLKRENLLGTVKLVLLENKLKKIGFPSDIENLND